MMGSARIHLGKFWVLLVSALALVPLMMTGAGDGQAAALNQGSLQDISAAPFQQEDIPNCGGLIVVGGGGCNKIQVVVMIDQSNSMRTNDRQGLRFSGAENLADLLAHRYLGALTAQAPPPTVELAVLHFGTDVPQQYNTGWMTIAPDSEEAWAAQFEELKTRISPDEVRRRGLNATNFINPFRAARDLFAQAEPQVEGCAQRVVLLLTDGAPAGAVVLREPALGEHMNQVAAIVQDGMSGEGNSIYVTAFNVRGDDYWRATKPYWTGITGDTPTADPPRSKQEDTPQAVASRMEQIVAKHIGYQSYSVEPGPITFPPYLQSMRITYYAPTPAATFSLVDPAGSPVVPDGQNVILTGEGTPIQVMDLMFPQSGNFQIATSAPGGIITLLPTYFQITPQIETSPSALQQFTNSEIHLTLLDASGRPVTRVDDPEYRMNLSAVLHQGDLALPLELAEAGSAFSVPFLPVSALPVRVEVAATLQDSQGQNVCRLLVDPGAEFAVAPVAVQVGEASTEVCTPSQMPVIYPLALINATTQAPASISVPITWQVNAANSAGQAVQAAVAESGAGQYRLTLRPAQADEIRTALAASAEVDGQAYEIFTGELVTTGLVGDRSLGFTLEKPGTAADRWSLYFNRLFHPSMRDFAGEILIGRRLFGWFGPQELSFMGRFFNQEDDTPEPGIERFYVGLKPASGGAELPKVNAWTPGEAGQYTLRLPAPGLGVYQVSAVDEGEAEACTSMGPLSGLNILLVNDFWEYLFWLALILLLIVLLAWLVMALVCRYANPPWGRLELIDPYGQVVWTGAFDSPDQENARHSCYTWTLDPPVFGVYKIRARSWDQPRHCVRISVYKVDGRQVFRGDLDQWQDIDIGNDLRIGWRVLAPGTEKPHFPGKTPDASGTVGKY